MQDREWVRDELYRLLATFDAIEALCKRYEESKLPQSKMLQEELKTKYGALKKHLADEYRRLSKANVQLSKPVSAFYRPAIHEAHVYISGFGTNLVTKNNLSRLQSQLYDARFSIRYYVPTG